MKLTIPSFFAPKEPRDSPYRLVIKAASGFWRYEWVLYYTANGVERKVDSGNTDTIIGAHFEAYQGKRNHRTNSRKRPAGEIIRDRRI